MATVARRETMVVLSNRSGGRSAAIVVNLYCSVCGGEARTSCRRCSGAKGGDENVPRQCYGTTGCVGSFPGPSCQLVSSGTKRETDMEETPVEAVRHSVQGWADDHIPTRRNKPDFAII
jgi:hypothetical protein